MTPTETVRSVALRLSGAVPGPDAAVLLWACTEPVWSETRRGAALAGVALVVAAHHARLDRAEADAVRAVLDRARAVSIRPDAELRLLRAKSSVAPAPDPHAAARIAPEPREPASSRAPVGDRLDIELQGHRCRVRFDTASRGKTQIIAALRAASADFRSRKNMASYWLMAADELVGLARRVASIGWFDRASLDRALVQLAAAAEQRRAMIEQAAALRLSLPPGCTPYAHQDAGIRFLLGRQSALLADDMGLGKTIQSIIAAEHAVPRPGQILIVAPATLTHNWVDEIAKWSPRSTAKVAAPRAALPQTRFVVVSYDSAKRQDKNPETGAVVDSPLRAALVGRAWPLVIFDEAHNVKNPTSGRHRLAADLRSDRIWQLTGTPMTNRPLDLWGLLVAGRHSMSADKMRFGTRYCRGYQGEHGWDFRGASNLPELSEKLSDWMLRRTKDEVLDLPPKIRVTQTCEVPRALAQATYADIGAMMRGRSELAQAKVSATVERAEDVLEAEAKVVIFSESLAALDRLQQKLAGHGVVRIDGSVPPVVRNEIVKRFQSDSAIRVFLGQTVAAGSGITLTAATSVIFNDLSLVPAYHAQAEDRSYRIGTTQRVTVTYMLAAARLDTAGWQMLRDKIDVITKFEDGLTDSDQAVTRGAAALLAALRA